jgi:hypothetical protein
MFKSFHKSLDGQGICNGNVYVRAGHTNCQSEVSLGGDYSSSLLGRPLASLLWAPAEATINWSYTDVLVGQGLGPVNSSYPRDCFARLKAAITRGLLLALDMLQTLRVIWGELRLSRGN